MKIKLIRIIMFLSIIQGIFATQSYCQANTETVELSVSSAIGNVGDEIDININLNNTAKFAATNLILNYNSKDLEYVSYTKGEVLESGAMSIVKNDSEKGKIAIGYVADPSSNDITIQSGNVLKIVFKLKSNLKQDTELKLECTSLKDKDGTDITSSITNGKIERVTSKNDNIEEDREYVKDTENTDNSQKHPGDITKLPDAGLGKTSIFAVIFVLIISISVILYKQNKNMQEIK